MRGGSADHRCAGAALSPLIPALTTYQQGSGHVSMPQNADGTAPTSPPPDPGKAGWGFRLRQSLHSHQSHLPRGTSRGMALCPLAGTVGDTGLQIPGRLGGVQTPSGSWFPPVVCPSQQVRVPPTNHISLLSIVSPPTNSFPPHLSLPPITCPSQQLRLPPVTCPHTNRVFRPHQSHLPTTNHIFLLPITSSYQSYLLPTNRMRLPPPALHVPPIKHVSHQSRVRPTNHLSRPPMASPLQLASPGGHGAGSGRDSRGRGCRRESHHQ